MPKTSVIKCPKCGAQPNIITDTCIKCGARLEKTCGDCGFGNSVEKNYCDQCGTTLILIPPKPEAPAAPAPAAPAPAPEPPPAPEQPRKLEMQPIQDTVSEKETSFRGRRPPEAKPAAAPEGQDVKPAKAAAPAPVTYVKAGPSLARRLAGPVVTLLLFAILLGIVYMIAAPSIPRFRLLMTAKAYLGDISQKRFEKAYEKLSSNSKSAITLAEYVSNSQEYYAAAPAWQFKDVQVFTINKDAAMIRYQLKEGTAPWKSDFISFVHEHDRWTRPYIWVLFQPIDEALKKGDFPLALFLSQKLFLTDPIDPRSSGYLCVTEFLMRLYDKSAESCRLTIDYAATYPVGYSSDELFSYYSNYADSLRYLERDRVALAEYEKLLKWPGVTSAEQCTLRLNRADSYVNLKDYDSALKEMLETVTPCGGTASEAEAKKRLAFLSGGAGPEAVIFSQKARFQPGMPPIGEARKAQFETLKARLGPKNAKLLPRDQWLAFHVTGPEYRVFLRQEAYNPRTRRTETQDIFIFVVNLWTNKARVEKAPPPPVPQK